MFALHPRVRVSILFSIHTYVGVYVCAIRATLRMSIAAYVPGLAHHACNRSGLPSVEVVNDEEQSTAKAIVVQHRTVAHLHDVNLLER